MTTALYTPYIAEVGILRTEEVVGINVPRRVLIDAVNETLDDFDGDVRAELAAKLMPVAETMDRFPVGTWMDAERGCGCVVGEYLVAADIIDREEAVVYESAPQIDRLLREQTLGSELYTFGTNVDIALNRVVLAEMGDAYGAEEITDLDAVQTQVYRNDGNRDVLLFFTDETTS